MKRFFLIRTLAYRLRVDERKGFFKKDDVVHQKHHILLAQEP